MIERRGQGAPNEVGDLPADAVIGTRIGTSETALPRAFPEAAGGARDWLPFSTNDRLIAALQEGTVQAIIVWEPVVWLAAGGEPAAEGLHVGLSPFAAPEVRRAIALPTNHTFLRSLLDPAIDKLRQSGRLAAHLSDFGLPSK